MLRRRDAAPRRCGAGGWPEVGNRPQRDGEVRDVQGDRATHAAQAGGGPSTWRPETLAVTSGRDESPGGPLNVPPTFASTFRDGDTVRYGR